MGVNVWNLNVDDHALAGITRLSNSIWNFPYLMPTWRKSGTGCGRMIGITKDYLIGKYPEKKIFFRRGDKDAVAFPGREFAPS